MSRSSAPNAIPHTEKGTTALEFRFTSIIARPRKEVFAFFRDIDRHAGQEGTLVPVYDKITSGPVGVGTRYREVVRLLPFIRGEIITEITQYEEGNRLGYRFVAMGMEGKLAYSFETVAEGTLLIQEQSFSPRGLLSLFRTDIGKMFSKMAGRRLEGIKAFLEQGAAAG